MFRFCAERLMSRRRYLVIFVLVFVCADLIYLNNFSVFDLPKRLYLLGISLAAALICLYKFSKKPKVVRTFGFVFLAAAVFCAGILYASAYNKLFFSGVREFANNEADVYGTVCSEPKLTGSGKYIALKIDASYIESGENSVENKGRIMAFVPCGSEINFGDGVKFTAKLLLPSENIDGFNYRNHLLSSGIVLTGFPKAYETYTARPTVMSRFMYFGHIVREKVGDYTEYVIRDSDASALLKGIMLGIKDDFSDLLYNSLSGAGLMHIAAVSGLHIMFLCAILERILGVVKFRLRGIFIIPLLIVFACVAAFTPSVLRAVIMVSIVLTARLLLKDADSLTSLFFAALVLIILNPYVIYSLSFCLSFAASLSLLIFVRPLSMWNRIISMKIVKLFRVRDDKKEKFIGVSEKILDCFSVPIACQILVIPLSVYYFGGVSPGAVIGNIIVIPCTMIAFSAGLINFVLYLIFPFAARICAIVVLYIPLKVICAAAAALKGTRINANPEFAPGAVTFTAYILFCAALYYIITIRAEDKLKLRTTLSQR